ncbi:MAG: hypothetical protein ABIG60_05620 [Patescibacteria group bacterium]
MKTEKRVVVSMLFVTEKRVVAAMLLVAGTAAIVAVMPSITAVVRVPAGFIAAIFFASSAFGWWTIKNAERNIRRMREDTEATIKSMQADTEAW